MRKFSVSLLAISFLLLVLTSCSLKKPVEPKLYFEAKATLHSEDMVIESKVISSSGNNITLSVISPESISTLNFSLSNSNLYINYAGLKCIASTDYLPSYSAVDVLFDTLSSLKISNLEYKKTEEYTDIYVGLCENGKFTLYVDSITGYIVRIKPSYTDCYITFTDIVA